MSQQTHAAATQLPWQERLRATPPTRLAVRVAIAALALFVVLWVLVLADEALVKEPRIFFRVLLLGLTLAGLFFVVASGFTLIFGLMRVVNMAHGSLYLLGGYFAFDLQQRLGGGSSVSTLGFSSAETSFWDWFLPLIAASFAIACHRSRHAAGLPTLEPGPGATTGADHDRDLGHPRRPDARPLRRAGGGAEATDQLAHERQRRRRLRLLPPRGARIRDRDRHRALPGDPPELASA